MFIPLHAHSSQGSIGDSILKVPDYIAKAQEYGLPALALTDHGSMASMYSFNEACKKSGIKPIIGCEVYETPDREDRDSKSPGARDRKHLVLLASTDEGLKNLLAIVNDAQLDGFYYKPRTDLAFMKKHGKGIIALSACVGGKIPQQILEENLEGARASIEEYKDAFDEFYLEIQPGDFEEQHVVNKALLELSRETDTPLVVTNDIHYLRAKDSVAHDAHVKIGRKMKFSDPQVYPDSCYWFMDRQTIIDSFDGTIPKNTLEDALDNTAIIADRCNVTLHEAAYMPRFLDGTTSEESRVLAEQCFAKLNEISTSLSDPSSYMSRLLYELDTIDELGFSGYFLIVQDFLLFAKREGIATGPGRGSVGGSLVAYLLGITLADPVKYDLMFERFLSKHRKGFPDIDMDFDSERRGEVMDYAVEKYGEDNCALVSTFMMRKARTAIRDTARILDIDIRIADQIAKLIPQVYYGDDGEKSVDLSIEESLEVVPELRQLERKYPQLFDMASKLSDVPSSASIHAAGVIVSPVSLVDKIPLIKSNKEGVNATALALKEAEAAGFIKFDFLSLASLNIYDKTQNDVGFTFDVLSSKFDDPKVWKLIGSSDTTGLFQISSKTYKSRMPRLKPKSIPELAATLALLRGPCISSGADKRYMEILEGKDQVDMIHPIYYAVTKETLGIVLYQEQIMELAIRFGFSSEEGYQLVKAISKKKMSLIEALEDKFRTNAKALNVDDYSTDRIWETILDAGKYSFNRAHAATYGILSYISAHLKAHYPKEFLKNLLTNAFNRSKKEEVVDAVNDCRRLGFQFLPPDANKSEWDFTIEDGKIRMGFCSVKGFGNKAAEEVILKRPYTSFSDFHDRVQKNQCTKRSIIPAIFAGVFDSITDSDPERSLRGELYESYCEMRKEDALEEIVLQSKERFGPHDDISVLEKIFFGAEFTSSRLNDLDSSGFLEEPINASVTLKGSFDKVSRLRTEQGKTYVNTTLYSGDGIIDCLVPHKVLKTYTKLIKRNNQVLLKAKKREDRYVIVTSVTLA